MFTRYMYWVYMNKEKNELNLVAGLNVDKHLYFKFPRKIKCVLLKFQQNKIHSCKFTDGALFMPFSVHVMFS